MATTIADLLVRVRGDVNNAIRALNDVDRHIKGVGNSSKKADADTSTFIRGLGRLSGRVGTIAAVGAKYLLLASAIASATLSAISLTNAVVGGVVTMSGVLALLPAVGLSAALAVGALSLAFKGVGDALKAGLSGDVNKFNEAIKGMGPATQATLKEIVGLKPALEGIKKLVQEQFFSQLQGQIRPLAEIYLPLLQSTLRGISGAFGEAARSVIDFFRLPETASASQGIFANMIQTIHQLTGAISPLTQALFAFIKVGSDFLPGLAEGIRESAVAFNTFIQRAAASGDLTNFISDALSLFGDLFHVLVQVGSIIRTVFEAGGEGTGLLTTIGKLTAGVAAFLKTAEGQAGLQAFFGALQTLGSIITTLITRMGPGLGRFLGALSTGIGNLAQAAGPVGDALNAVLIAVAPLLPVLGDELAVILTGLAGIIRVFAAEAGPFILIWSTLAQNILPMLLPLIATLVQNGLPLAITLFHGLVEAMWPLVPVITEFARQLIEQLLPVLPQWAVSLGQIIPPLLQLAHELVPIFIAVLKLLIPLIPVLVTGLSVLISVIGVLVRWAGNIIEVFSRVIGIVRQSIEGWLAFLRILAGVPPSIAGIFSSAGTWLVNAGKQILQGLINGILAMIGPLRSALQRVTNLIPDWKGPPEVDRRLLRPSGQLIMRGFILGIDDQIPHLRDQLRGLTSEMPHLGRTAAVSPAAGPAVDYGRMSGALRSGVGDLIEAIAGRPIVVQVGSRDIAIAYAEGQRDLDRRG